MRHYNLSSFDSELRMQNRQQFIPIIGFLDESYNKDLGSTLRIMVGCCLFGADRWMLLHDKVATVSSSRRRKRLTSINSLLSEIGGIAVLGFADILLELLPKGKIDDASDIPKMSRNDNTWGMVVLLTMYKAIALLQRNGISPGRIDLYYDQKSLSVKHRSQLANILRYDLPMTAKEAAVKYPGNFTGDPSEIRFGTIQEVSKPDSYKLANAFQNGTALSHHLCSQSKAIIKHKTENRIWVRDFSLEVANMIGKFD